jgi:hypothetical protein
MIEFIPSSDFVLAIRVSGRVDGDDLDSALDRLEAKLDSNDLLHIYVETREIDGIDIAGLGRYTARALPLFGKLRRFGRVAVVADQSWVRIGSRIEAGLLPFIDYRVFEPHESEQALAWVEGTTA